MPTQILCISKFAFGELSASFSSSPTAAATSTATAGRHVSKAGSVQAAAARKEVTLLPDLDPRSGSGAMEELFPATATAADAGGGGGLDGR